MDPPAENQENWTPAMSVGRDTPNILQNLAGTAMAGGSCPITPPILLSGCSSMSSMSMLSGTQEGSSPRATAPTGSMSSVDEQRAAPSIRPSCSLPAGCTQVPISIVVFHRRPTGRGSKPQLPPSHSLMPAPASSGVAEDGASVQQNCLSLGGASKVNAGGVAMNPSELGIPDKYNSGHAPINFQPNGLYTEASRTGTGREPSQLQQSATVIFDSRSRLESVIPANTEEKQGQHPQESTGQVAEGSADGNIHMSHRVRKRPKTQVNHSDNTNLSAPVVCKERTLTQIEILISNADKTETFKSEETPAQKPKTRRKKHRAKVIHEKRPAKMQKPTVKTPNEKPLDQKVKRSYVRKKRNLSSLEKCSEPVGDQSISRETGISARSNIEAVRRRLQFEFKEQGVHGEQSSMANSWNQKQNKPVNAQSSLCSVTKSSAQNEHELQVDMENSPGGFAFGMTCKLNKMLDEYIHLPEAAPNPAQEVPPATSGCISMEVDRKQDDVGHTHYPDSTSKSGLCTAERRGLTTMEVNKKDLDLNYSNTGGFQMYCSASSLLVNSTKSQMTEVSKIEKNHAQHYDSESSLAGTRNSVIMRTAAEMLACYQAGGIKKKRSARVRRNSFLSVMDLKKNTSQESTRLPQSCMEALYESSYIKFMTKKRSQKVRLNSPNSIQPNIEQKNMFSSRSIFYGGFSESKRSEETFQQTIPQTPDNKWINLDIHCEVSEGSSAKTSTVAYMDYLQGVASKLKFLDLNTEMHLSQTMPSVASLGAINGLSNALVPYGGGVVVPYQTQLHLVKKQRPRAKVDLDFETTRVWNLLMGKAADPVDGTDVEKERWWQQEREVFQGRANSFIARMRLVQGDRHFSPWKGSVVDSVVGVFLTQNVADHLSSSAYMALAARFPPGSVRSNCNADTTGQDNEEIISMSAVEDKNMFDFFYNGSIPDLGVNCEELSMNYEKTHTEPKDSTTANELINCENYSLYYTEPTGSFSDHQTGIDHKAKQFPDFSTVESTAYMKSPRETQFQKEMSSSQSVVTSESILEPGIPLSSGIDRAPRNFVGGTSAAAFWQMGNNFDDGKSLAGNDSTVKETESQGIETAAVNNDVVGEPGIPSGSIMSPLFSTIDCPQLDVRNYTHVSSTSPNSSIGSASPNFPIGTIEEKFSLFMPFDAHLAQRNGNMTVDATLNSLQTSTELTVKLLHYDRTTRSEASDMQGHESLYATRGTIPETAQKADDSTSKFGFPSYNGVPDTAAQTPKPKKPRNTSKKNTENLDWDKLRRQACSDGHMKERTFERRDSVDWEAVRCADVHRISHAIRERGMNNVLAERIQKFLNRLVSDHGSIDLEWLRDIPPDSAKDYLLSIRGLGLKSVECVRLLTLHHLAFPVDTNVGRICVRLGWVPIQPLPESLQLHLLELYPVLETIQKYLWPRLCKLDQQTLYELHYQMITFGKVFCTKNKPNCNACPMRSECKHFASAFASARLALPSPQDKRLVKLNNQFTCQNGTMPTPNSALPRLEGSIHARNLVANNAEPIIEEPASPKEEECPEILENDIEDFDEDTGEIPTIKLNMEAFAQNLENCIKESNKDLQSDDIAKALVAISTEAASIPVPKLKNVHRLRTEHYVYELPDSHPLVQQLELHQREPDDPTPYLMAIWMPDELKEMSEAPKPYCDSQMEGGLCSNGMCHNCIYERENESRYVRGTILVPCRTAMRGSFPLNGTYFQVNEVFADHKSSYNPIHVAREQLWSLQRRMVYFGTSVPTIFKGLRTEEIQQCFWRGFVCVRGFDMETRAPRPLCPHFHLAASKLRRSHKKAANEQTL